MTLAQPMVAVLDAQELRHLLLRALVWCGPTAAAALRGMATDERDPRVWRLALDYCEERANVRSRLNYLRAVLRTCRQQLGSMDDVAEDVTRDRGPVDYLGAYARYIQR